MSESPPQKNSRFFVINLLICILGTLVILWFAFGVEKQNSPAQRIFEWMLGHSQAIIVILAGLIVLVLALPFIGKRGAPPE